MDKTLTEDHKNVVCHDVCIALGHAIKFKKIPDRELCEVCNFILVAFKSMQSHEEMIDFLGKLSARWSVFSAVFLAEKQKADTISSL